MKKSYLVTPLIAGALILPTALPATAAQADVPASAAVSTVNKTKLTADQVKAERAALNSRINMLRETQKAIPGSEYADQIEDLIKTALDLSGAIDTIAHGGVPAYDPATIVPRIHLAIDAADAIKSGNTTLQHKVKRAHVELGLEIAKASIVAINPASSVAQVQDEIKALKDRIDKVSAYPDLSKDDTATIAYKQTLRKTIHEVRVGRNKNIVGKKDQAVVDTLNKEISKADKVRANAKSTVTQVDTAVDQLRAAYQTALNAPDKAKK